MSVDTWVSGLIGAAVALALVSIAERTQKRAVARSDGWKALRPSWLTSLVIVVCAGFAALMCYFFWIGGSALPDAGTQNAMGVLLLALAMASAIYLGWTTHGRIIRWKGDELRVRSLFGRESARRLSEVTAVKKSDMRGEYRVDFRDGSRLWFSAYAQGADELITKMPRTARRD